jgi:hypothetical protein
MQELVIPFILDATVGLVILAYGFVLGAGLNIIVAIAEILLFRYLYKVKKMWWVILLANFVSLVIGTYILFYWWGYCSSNSKPLMMPVVLVVLFIITVIVEFPFFIWATKPQLSIKKIMLATFIINLITSIFAILVHYALSLLDSNYLKLFSLN